MQMKAGHSLQERHWPLIKLWISRDMANNHCKVSPLFQHQHQILSLNELRPSYWQDLKWYNSPDWVLRESWELEPQAEDAPSKSRLWQHWLDSTGCQGSHSCLVGGSAGPSLLQGNNRYQMLPRHRQPLTLLTNITISQSHTPHNHTISLILYLTWRRSFVLDVFGWLLDIRNQPTTSTVLGIRIFSSIVHQ